MDSKYGGPVFVANMVNQLLNVHDVPNKILTMVPGRHGQNSHMVVYRRTFHFWDFSVDFLFNAHKEIKICDGLLVHGVYSFMTLWVCILAVFYKKPVFLRPAGMFDFHSIGSGGIRKSLFRIFYLALTAGFVYTAARTIIFNSSKEARNSLFGSSKKSKILPNGVNPALISIDQKNKVYEKKFKCFFLGRLDKIKGVELIIEAFSVLDKKISENIELFVAGEGDEDFVKTLKMRSGSNIKYLGHLNGSIKYHYLNECDIYLQPSRTEGLSNSMLEAMFCRVAMITTNQVGLAEELESSEAALIINFDAQELRNAITELVKSPALVEKFKSNAFDFVAANYDFTVNIENYISMFRAACDRW